MTGDFSRWVLQGFMAPRQTVRRFLDSGHGPDVAVLLLLLGYLIEAIFVLMLAPPVVGSSGMGAHVSGLITTAFVFVVISVLVFRLGKLAGGTGTFPQTILAVAWYMFMGSLLSPIMVPFFGELGRAAEAMDPASDSVGTLGISGGVQIMFLAAGMFSVWLFANSIAALHGFRSIWGVIGVLVGIPLIASFVIVTLTGGLQQ